MTDTPIHRALAATPALDRDGVAVTRPARALRTVALLLALGGGVTGTGCSDGGGGGGAVSGIAADGSSSGIAERYVSGIDSSATAAAVAAGHDPVHAFLGDTFECHDEADAEVAAPELSIGFSGDGGYATPDGVGRVGIADGEDAPSRRHEFRGGPLDGRRVHLVFDDFGQRFELDANGTTHQCYQRGASAARAVALARLATPQAGDYRCREAEGGRATLSIDADGRYAVGEEAGTWTLSDVVGNESGRMAFSGGPLDGESARYSEEPDNGYRSFSVSTSRRFGPLGLGGASSTLALTCESFGPPVTMPLYGPAPAPALASAPSGPTGFWWHTDILTSVNDSHAEVRHLLLRPDGYAFAGTPPTAGVDCGRTRPNGLPFCDAWTLEGETLRLHRPYGEPREIRLGLEGGTLREIRGERARPVVAVDPGALVGERENLSYFQSGCVGLGYCSYGLTRRALGLAADGRFRLERSGEGGSSFDGSATGGVSTYAVGSSNASFIGDWSVAGNTLELAYDSGRTVRHFVVADDGSIGVGELLY